MKTTAATLNSVYFPRPHFGFYAGWRLVLAVGWIAMLLFGALGGGGAFAAEGGQASLKACDPKGRVLIVAVEGPKAEELAEPLGAAIQARFAEAAAANIANSNLAARIFATASAKETAKIVLNTLAADRKEIGAVINLILAPPTGNPADAPPRAVAEVYHYAFGPIAKEHVSSPEYSFKFGSDSALMAINLHRLATGKAEAAGPGKSAATLFPEFEIAPASQANLLLPASILRKTVRLTVPEEKVAGAKLASFAGYLADAFVSFQSGGDCAAMGVVSDKAKRRGGPANLQISISLFTYNDKDTAQGQEGDSPAAATAPSAPVRTIHPFSSGLYYADNLTTVTPYTLTVTDPAASDLRKAADKGAFVTSSLRGIVRTVPVRLESYTPLGNPAPDDEDADNQIAAAAIALSAAETFDTIIEGATVFDGTKDGKRFRADVGIVGERIAAVGDLKGRKRTKTIAGAGLFLMPGFIDIHSHADNSILEESYAPSHVRQGITTVLAGNCSFSPLDIGGFLRSIEVEGAAINLGELIGNRPVRRRVLGERKGMFPYGDLYREKELVDLGMEEGAFGMSSGLIYTTSEEAFAWELAEMAKQLKPYGGFYASHVRGESDEVLDAIREAIYIGEIAEVPVQISHMKVLSKRNWGQMADYLLIMKSARARGLDVTGDQYPWRASGPAGHYGLYKLMVREAIENESPEVVFLKDMPGKYARYSGRTLNELLDAEKMTPEDLIKDLNLTPKSKIYAAYLCIGEDDLLLPMKEDFVMVCTDAGLVSLEDIEQGKVWDDHPRKFRSYPEFFAKYVRDRNVCSWELGVFKCTGLPAWRMKLADRGVIRPGAYADLVLLDPERLDPAADYRDQTAPPKGILYVFLNGQAVVKDGQMTKVRAGKPLFAYGHRKP